MSGYIALAGGAAITATALLALEAQSNFYADQYNLSGGQRDAFAHAYISAYLKQKLMALGVSEANASANVYAIGFMKEAILNVPDLVFKEGAYNKDMYNNAYGVEYDPTSGITPEQHAKNGIDQGKLIISENPAEQGGKEAPENFLEEIIDSLKDLQADLLGIADDLAEALSDFAESAVDFFENFDIPPFTDEGGFPLLPLPGLPVDGPGGVGDGFGNGMSSPIVLDLDGDGLEYLSRANSNVFFDIDNDGFAEHVQWLKGDDGFLVRDLNGNGQIDSVAEMFGDNDGTTAYAKLDLLDTDNPSGNILNASDAAWSSLRVWKDANENGRVDSGELHTLSSLGITSINTSHTNDTVLGGQPIAGQSTFVMNGNTHTAADVLFETDQLNSWYVGNGAPGDTDINLTTLILPLSRGYGTLPSLHYAMTDDAALKGMIADFANLDLGDIDDIYDMVENIILRWADAEGIALNSRGPNFDASHLEVLERVVGQDFISAYAPYDGTPSDFSTGWLGQAYADFMNEIMERLLVQGPLKAVFPDATYSFAEDKLHLNATLDEVLTLATANQPTPGTDAYTVYWNEIARIVDHYHDDLGTTAAEGRKAVDDTSGLHNLPPTIIGTSGADFIASKGTSAIIYGGAGNDTMAGYDGHAGSGGNDIYLFKDESGSDEIRHHSTDGSGHDAVRFTTLNATDVVLTKSGDDLVITASSISQTITVKDHYHVAFGGMTFNWGIKEIQFANGEIWDLATINTVANGGSAVATLSGTAGNDTLTATSTTLNMTGGAGADRFVIDYSSGPFVTITDFNPDEGDLIDLTAFTSMIDIEYRSEDLVGHAVLNPLHSNTKINIAGYNLHDLDPKYFRSDTIYYATGQVYGGSAGADTISATVANDTIYANEGADSVWGDVGHDVIYGWTGNDTLKGGAGRDTIGGDAGTDSIEGGDHDDALYGGDDNDTIWGGYGSDFLGGDAGNDSLMGYDWTNSGEPGNDTLDGGAGNDAMHGGAGDDTYYVDSASDVVVETVSNGIDTVFTSLTTYNVASGANDHLENIFFNGIGDASIRGNGLANAITGGAGNDTLYGGNQSDTIHGEDGNDILNGEAGNDSVMGGEGNDTIYGSAGTDILHGGNGSDLAHYFASSAGIMVDLSAAMVIGTGGDAAGDTLIGIEHIYGSNAGGDSLTGDAGDNLFFGHAGSDMLYGNEGNDTLNGGSGNDSMEGGAGDDIYYIDSASDVIIEAASNGIDTVYTTLNADTISSGTNDHVENIIFIGTGNFSLVSNGLANSITGGSGHDAISGGNGNDTIYGGAGNDSLYGGAHNDVIYGGIGNDSMEGSAGDDTYYIDSASDIITETASNGIDTVYTTLNADTIGSGASDHIENIIFIGAGNFNLVSNGLANSVTGANGHDSISGGNGNDTIYGNAGSDSLYGGAHNDVIYGGDANDDVAGDAGNDSLYGGDGNDRFYFITGHGNDIIYDFAGNGSSAGDSLRLVSIGFSTGAGVLSATADDGNGNTVITTSGGTITLIGVLKSSLHASDFTFV